MKPSWVMKNEVCSSELGAKKRSYEARSPTSGPLLASSLAPASRCSTARSVLENYFECRIGETLGLGAR